MAKQTIKRRPMDNEGGRAIHSPLQFVLSTAESVDLLLCWPHENRPYNRNKESALQRLKLK
jgi:hypothetical protein